MRYATGIDRRDWAAFRSCFTDDVVAEYDGVGTWTGSGAITEFMVTSHESMGHTMHRLSNLAIEVDGDTATAQCYVDGGAHGGRRAVGARPDRLLRRRARAHTRRVAHRPAALHDGPLPSARGLSAVPEQHACQVA